jgi:hypothetical protein
MQKLSEFNMASLGKSLSEPLNKRVSKSARNDLPEEMHGLQIDENNFDMMGMSDLGINVKKNASDDLKAIQRLPEDDTLLSQVVEMLSERCELRNYRHNNDFQLDVTLRTWFQKFEIHVDDQRNYNIDFICKGYRKGLSPDRIAINFNDYLFEIQGANPDYSGNLKRNLLVALYFSAKNIYPESYDEGFIVPNEGSDKSAYYGDYGGTRKKKTRKKRKPRKSRKARKSSRRTRK